MYSIPDIQSTSLAENDAANCVKCMICYKDFNSAKANRPDYEISKRIFDNYARLLKVQLILPMQWNFRQENLPFCVVCTSTVSKLLELNEKLHIIQNEIRVTLQNTKIEILKTQDANCKRMMEPLGRRRGTRGSASHLEKVDYFRSFAVKDMDPDVRLNVNNLLLKPLVQVQPLPKVGLPLQLQKHKQETVFDLNALKRLKVIPFSDKAVNQDEYPEYDNAPSPDNMEMEDDHSDGAENSEVNSQNYVAEGLIKLPENINLTPKDYVSHYFTKVEGSGNPHRCNLCDRTFSLNYKKSVGNLKRHIVTAHEKGKGYQCKFCLKTFSSSSEGLGHVRSEHSTIPIIADQVLKNKSRVTKDIPLQKTNEAIPMEEILKRVIDLESGDKRPPREIYKRHYKKVGDIYVCKICTRQLKSIKDIVRHVHATHKGKPNFQCSYCNKKFMERYMCVKHLKIAHDQLMQEEYQVLIVNENKQPSEEREEDEESSFSTDKAESIKPFVKIGKAFKCTKCSFSSIHRTSMMRHNSRWHKSMLTRPGLVKFSFAKKTAKVSTTVASFSTNEVDKTEKTLASDGDDGVLFVGPQDLNALVKPHILDGKSKYKKRYKCKNCSYGSAAYCNVRRHVRDVHLKIAPYSCSYCKKAFYSRQKCRLHIILTHPQENESNLAKKSCKPTARGSSLLLGSPKLQPVEVEADQNPELESENIDSNEGTLNDSRLRRRKSNVNYVQDTIDIENEIERLCITLPKSEKMPFSPELLSRYISESDSTFCLVCEKQFSQISHHIANVHEEVRHFQCFFCQDSFYYRSKCIRHLKEKCLRQNKKQGGSYIDDMAHSTSSSQSTVGLVNTTKPTTTTVPKISKPKTKKLKAVPKYQQPLQSGVYKDYYERNGKRFKCKICQKRILDSRRIATHFISNHKDLCLFECGHCDEKFYSKPHRTKHWYVSHPDVAAELAKEYEKTLSAKQNEPQQPNHVDNNDANNGVDIGETTIKSESTWVEFSHPVEEPRDQFLESNNESEPVTSTARSSPFQEEERSVPETSVTTTSSANVDYSTEKSIENDAPKVEYGCIVIHQQSNLNCDPFIDKDSANKCKVCNKSFKLRKLVIDHIKNVHLGVRRYQCEFCPKKYYHLAACKTHVEDHHPPGSMPQSRLDGIADTDIGEQQTAASFGSSDLQISNVRSQASMDRMDHPLVSSEEITINASIMAVEEPMSFEPWRELPSSQDKNIEPFFAFQSDDSGEEEDEEEPQFVVQEQNGLGFSTDYDMSGSGVITDEVSIYDIVGTENIIDLPVNPVHFDGQEFLEIGNGFKCKLCPKEFAVRKSMINHVNVKHKQVARFGCKLCDKKYYHKYHVAQHIASIHMRKDIFKCRVCEKSYGHASGLKKHYAAAHGSVNFQSREQWCTICKLPFQSPQDLISHMSRSHPM